MDLGAPGVNPRLSSVRLFSAAIEQSSTRPHFFKTRGAALYLSMFSKVSFLMCQSVTLASNLKDSQTGTSMSRCGQLV